MTIINRALHKAYKRRSDVQSGAATEQPEAVVGGWASQLREPNRPIPAHEPSVASPPDAASEGDDDGSPAARTTPVRRKAEGPIVAPAGVAVRVDAPHSSAPGPLLVDARPVSGRQTESLSVEGESSRGHTADLWAWPPVVQKLLTSPAGAEIRRLAGRLKQLASERGLECLAVSGTGRSAGRTSLVLTLARALTESCSARVVVVDADFQHPDVARMISIRPHAGLWDVACEHRSSSSPLTTLIPGKLAIVPLVARVSPAAIDRRKIAALQAYLRAMRRGYDLVLVDAGPWESLIPPLVFENGAIDAFIGVSRYNDDEQLDDSDFRQPGIEWLGTVETFSPASQLELKSA